jgi:hypothetical protein
VPDRNRLPTCVFRLPPQGFPSMRPMCHSAGRLRYDTLVNGRICILPTWRLTTSDRKVAARIATLLGGEPYVDDGSEQFYQVVIDHAEIDVLLDGPQAIRVQMLRRHGSTVVRCCDGRTQRTALGKEPCQCPRTLKGRWRAAKMGHGCEPLVHVALRLAADPTLGRFLLASATWSFADHAASVKAVLHRTHGPVRARLSINRSLHTTSRGTTFAYTRPSITVLPGL